jgi:hypothetical protein
MPTRRNEQKAAKIPQKNGCQTFAIFALLTCNFAQFGEEVQNGPSESVQYELVARRYADTPLRRHPDTPIQYPFVVAALPRCDLLFNSPICFAVSP